MENFIKESLLIKKGRGSHSPYDLSQMNEQANLEQVEKGIRAYLFSLGQPLVYEKDDSLLVEYPDGSLERI